MQLTFTATEKDMGVKLSLFLRRQGVSTSLLRSVKYTRGGILVNGAPARTNQMLLPGQQVAFTLPPDEGFSAAPEDIPFAIVYEDTHAMVLEKPAGLVVHPTRSHTGGTLANAFCGLMQSRGLSNAFRPIGRLDGGTSGLMLLAMNAYSAPLLAQSLQKSYLAIAAGEMRGEGFIEEPLGPAGDSVIRQCVRADGRPSKTEYRVLETRKNATLVWVKTHTGRTHQIRAHFAHLGHPLVGDALYGGPGGLTRHALHCARLSFALPDQPCQSLQSSLPQDMCTFVENTL